MKFSIESLKKWFEEEKRDFPWRKDPSPYAVWVSEVMLQQTRASVVVSYFERWMARFPSIEDLGMASLDEVIKLWEGLGYYARARSLHAGAQYLMEHHGGKLPSDPKELVKVKGLGPYTIGAIQSFAFHQKASAVDGNVLRVIARLFRIHDAIDRSDVKKQIGQIVFDLLPDTEPWVIMEALIELGASICTKKPVCERCPMNEDCMAYRLGEAEMLPKKKKKVMITSLERSVFVISHEGAFLVQKQIEKKLMAGLHEFPYVEKGEKVDSFYPGKLQFIEKLKPMSQAFTRYKVQLFPEVWHAQEKKEVEGFIWKEREALSSLAFSSGHRKILDQILEEYANLTY